jgi:hypothetical protein
MRRSTAGLAATSIESRPGNCTVRGGCAAAYFSAHCRAAAGSRRLHGKASMQDEFASQSRDPHIQFMDLGELRQMGARWRETGSSPAKLARGGIEPPTRGFSERTMTTQRYLAASQSAEVYAAEARRYVFCGNASWPSFGSRRGNKAHQPRDPGAQCQQFHPTVAYLTDIPMAER